MPKNNKLLLMQLPLERTSSMRLLGYLWTGYISGQILVGAILFVGILFMGDQGFNILSVAFFIGFVGPTAYYFHKRLVSRGRELMQEWCDLTFEDPTLSFKTGFPNTMDPDWQSVQISENNRNLVIKGNPTGGYHLRLSGSSANPTRLGLWLNLDEARSGAADLAAWLKGNVSEEIKISDQEE